MGALPVAALKLLHYLDVVRLERGGVVRAVLDMVQVMATAGHQVRLLAHDISDVPDAWRSDQAAEPRAFAVDPFRPWGRLPTNIAQHLEWAEVLHIHTPWDLRNPLLAKAAKRLGRPYVLTVHGMLDDWCMQQRGFKKNLYLALRGRRLLEGAALVQCTAQAERDQAGRQADAAWTVLPYIVDTQPYEQLPGPQEAQQRFELAQDGPFTVLFLSRLHPKKGLEHLIDAVAEVAAPSQGLKVLIAGPGPDQYVEQLRLRARQRGVAQQVTFVGEVYGRLKLSLYQAADAFVLPTSQENFGLVLVEALACGTAVVTTRGTDIWAELEAAGALVVEQKAQAIARAIESLLADRSHGRALGERGRAWVMEHFGLDRQADQYEAMYRQALSRVAAGRGA
ncbi:MAG: glycosyltransferase [Phycisphaeraceae bacterium]|nr:glycosyltransferase [Phycisphaeraceae bacterium]